PARRAPGPGRGGSRGPPPPPRPLGARPRLFELLDRGVEGPMTLISAPAGAGKTSLLASWLAAKPRQVAWLTPRPQLTEAGVWAEGLAPGHPVAPPPTPPPPGGRPPRRPPPPLAPPAPPTLPPPPTPPPPR